MCDILEISRSNYYEWLYRPICKRKEEDKEALAMINQVFIEARKVYGTRRIKKKLEIDGIRISRRRIGRLMKESGIFCKTKRRFKATTDSNHNRPIAPNLLERKFNVQKPNQCWVGDITYINTEEGWLYLSTVIDLYSRKIIGWSMSNNMKSELVNKALLMALWQRKPDKGLMWHTDRGSQYASDSHLQIIRDHSIRQSMSRKANCWDNAVAESFFHTLKTELTHQFKFKTREEARQSIFEYIEVFYNRVRIHSSNNYLSPNEYEQQQLMQKTALRFCPENC